jgi:hypothetical protein
VDAAATAAIGAGCAALGGLVGGVLLPAYDHRKQLRTAGLVDVVRKRHTDRYDALRRLAGIAAELFGCLTGASLLGTPPWSSRTTSRAVA